MSDYPMVQAKWFTHGGNENPTRIVVHRMEAPEKGDTAESCARYFQTTTRPASAHLCVDNNSIVRCVNDGDIAYHAPPNKGSLGIEHAGLGEDWAAGGQYDVDMLALSAKAVARWCRQYNIPVVWLSPQDLRDGKHGITSHYNVSQAWRQTSHTDGQFFPYAAYLVMVRTNLAPAPVPPKGVKVANHVKSLTAPNGGVWHLQADGGIVTDHLYDGGQDAPFYGSVPGAGGLPAGMNAVDLVPDRGGYAVVATHPDGTVSYYNFPAV
jgi:hypothetical protein